MQEDFEEEAVVPLPVMPYNGTGATYVILARPEGSIALGKFVNILRFTVKEVDPGTGEAEEDGYEDEYQLEDIDITPASYIKPSSVANFRKVWDEMDTSTEREDDYGLGTRDTLQVHTHTSSLPASPRQYTRCRTDAAVLNPPPPSSLKQEAVEAVIGILGMVPCEGTDAVPPNSRSHTVLLSGTFVGGLQALVRMNFGIDGGNNVAMKLCVRAEDEDVSEAIHQIIQDA